MSQHRPAIYDRLTWVRTWEFDLEEVYCPHRDNTPDPCCQCGCANPHRKPRRKCNRYACHNVNQPVRKPITRVL